MEKTNINDRRKRSSDWILRYSKSKPGKFYYHNVKTRKSTWTRPEDFVEEASPSPSSSSSSKVVSPEKKSHKRSSSALQSTSSEENNQLLSPSSVSKTALTNKSLELHRKRDILVDKRPSKADNSSNSLRNPDINNISPNALQGNKMRKTIKARRSKTKEEKQTSVSAAVHLISDSMRSEESDDIARSRNLSNIPGGEQNSCNKVEANENTVAAKRVTSGKPLPTLVTRKSPESLERKKRRRSNSSATPAADRLEKLKSVLINEQKPCQHPSLQEHKKQCILSDECEAMDVEYMDSEVLIDIGELRQQNVGQQLDQRPIFMDMDVDYFDTSSQLEPKQTCYVVLDTNILLSHLTFAQGLRDITIPGKGDVHLYLPWQVLHELDHLKDKGKANIQPLARKAINYLHQNFSSKHPRVCGQNMRDSAQNTLNCPDDNIIEACLQLKKQGFTNVVLLSNDINLLNKALLCDIQALNKLQFSASLPARTPQIILPNEIVGNESNSFQNDIFLSEIICIVTDSLTAILSQGMEEEYKSLWKKRTIISPPWTAEQALLCLSHHWMAVCGDFIPKVVKKCIDDLKYALKVKSKCDEITVADLKGIIELVQALLSSIPKKYNNILTPTQQNIKTLLLKLDGVFSPKGDEIPTVSDEKLDSKYMEVYICFEEALNAAQSLCDPNAVSTPDWRMKAGSMIEALQQLAHLMDLLLSLIGDSLREENPVVVELVNLIKGKHPITAKDLVQFCKPDRNRTLLSNGAQQIKTLYHHLSSMVQSSLIL